MDPTEIIIAAAIRYGSMTVSMPPPARHHTILEPLHKATGKIIQPDDQGFLTNKGRFVGRTEGRDIAVHNMKIEPSRGYSLFSEDLW